MEFCEEEETLQQLWVLARELQPLACSMVREGFSFCGTDLTELQETNHILSAHFQDGTLLQAHGGLDTLAAAAGALQAHGSTTERSSEPGTLAQRDQHLSGAPPTESTTFLQPQHGDDQATESLTGITLPSGGVEHEAASRGDVFRSSLSISGLGESPYLGTSAELTNWRSADQSQYMWQENEVTDSNWGVWWEDWNLGGINVPLISDGQSAF